MQFEKGTPIVYTNGFKFVNSKQEAIDYLIEKGLGFGWYNGEFITNPEM